MSLLPLARNLFSLVPATEENPVSHPECGRKVSVLRRFSLETTGDCFKLTSAHCHLQYNFYNFTSDSGIVNTHPRAVPGQPAPLSFSAKPILCSFSSITVAWKFYAPEILVWHELYTSPRVKNGVRGKVKFARARKILG